MVTEHISYDLAFLKCNENYFMAQNVHLGNTQCMLDKVFCCWVQCSFNASSFSLVDNIFWLVNSYSLSYICWFSFYLYQLLREIGKFILFPTCLLLFLILCCVNEFITLSLSLLSIPCLYSCSNICLGWY